MGTYPLAEMQLVYSIAPVDIRKFEMKLFLHAKHNCLK